MSFRWEKFENKNPDVENAFEALSYSLFCRKYEQNEGVFRYRNQTGIETDPITAGEECIGFQSKWSSNTIPWDKIKKSVNGAKEKNPKLNKVILYLNKEIGESSKKSKKKGKAHTNLEDYCSNLGINIEFFSTSQFQIYLEQPKNSDLAQLYFGHGDELGFIKSMSMDIPLNTFLQSSEYISLLIKRIPDGSAFTVEDLIKNILEDEASVFFIQGHAGSGKSYLMHKLFRSFSGLDKTTDAERKEILRENGSIPVYIKLMDCFADTLESLIRARLNDYNLTKSHGHSFIYLLDGLDELDEHKAGNVIFYLNDLYKNAKTKKIIISCRSATFNSVYFKNYFNQKGVYYEIEKIQLSIIYEYLQKISLENFQNNLNRIRDTNPFLIEGLSDVLSLRLFCEHITRLDGKSKIYDLFELKIGSYLKDSAAKNISSLNLFHPKHKHILELNKIIAFEFQKKMQFNFPLNELQNIILKQFPLLDYDGVNKILEFQSSLFFDHSLTYSKSNSGEEIFRYQHRRYQEYFFIQNLVTKYEIDRKVLREVNILYNSDLMNLFIHYAKNNYKQNNNFPGILEMNLLEVYAGKSSNSNSNLNNYFYSGHFFPALAAQTPESLSFLFEEDFFDIRGKIIIDPEKFDQASLALNSDLSDENSSNISKFVDQMEKTIKAIYFFWEEDKVEFVNTLVPIFKKAEKIWNALSQDKAKIISIEPYAQGLDVKCSYEYIYYKIVVEKKDILNFLKMVIRPTHAEESIPTQSLSEKSKLKLADFFEIVILKRESEISDITSDLSNEEFKILINRYMQDSLIKFFIKNEEIKSYMKDRMSDVKITDPQEHLEVLLCKRLLNIELSSEDENNVNQLTGLLEEEMSSSNSVLIKYKDTYHKSAILKYIEDPNYFHNFYAVDSEYPIRPLLPKEYISYGFLYSNFIGLLLGDKGIEDIISAYLSHSSSNKVCTSTDLLNKITILWANIFSCVEEDKLPLIQFFIERNCN